MTVLRTLKEGRIIFKTVTEQRLVVDTLRDGTLLGSGVTLLSGERWKIWQESK
jgi:hypothetical protein